MLGVHASPTAAVPSGVRGIRTRSLVVVGLWVAAASPAGVVDKPYRYRTYTQILAYFEDLKRQCPDIVETWVAQDVFPEILNQKNKKWGTCDRKPCQTLIVRIANKQKLTNTRPEVFFSGALHGDERVGPTTVTELAGFLCDQHKRGVEDVVRLVDTRSIWLAPMTNAEGYANNHRDENGMDPNRDFPYTQNKKLCMRTQTGRTVNELFRRHLFHFMITFHGGMRALTYEWGSKNHVNGRLSTESPDDRAFVAVGTSLMSVLGQKPGGQPWYPFGRITDLVYWVDGGMEDWSYGAGFEASPYPITVCKPKTYGGYKKSRTVYKPGSIATLVYLVEMSAAKTPAEGTLGRTTQVWGNQQSDGHVSRNLRLALNIIELTRPEVVMQSLPFPTYLRAGMTNVSLELYGFGCLFLAAARLLLIPRNVVDNCSSLSCPSNSTCDDAWRQRMLDASHKIAEIGPMRCHGLSIWKGPPAGPTLAHLAGAVPAYLGGLHCAVVAAEFDQDWGMQKHPDPHVSPRSIAARLRLEDHYTAEASDGDMRVDEYKTKLFPVYPSPVQIARPTTAVTSTTSTTPRTTTLSARPLAAIGHTSPKPVAPSAASGPAPAGKIVPSNTSESGGVVGAGVVKTSAESPQAASGLTSPALAQPQDVDLETGLEEGAPLLLLVLVFFVAALCLCNTIEAWRLRRTGRSWQMTKATTVGHASVAYSEAAQLDRADSEEARLEMADL